MAGSLKNRLILGAGAVLFGRVGSMASRFLVLPVFLAGWGAELYGEWLILTAMAAALTMSNMGFGSATQNDMTMRYGAGDIDGALETYQSSLMLYLAVLIPVFGGWVLFLSLADFQGMFNISIMSDEEAFQVGLFVGAAVLFRVVTGLNGAGLVSVGHFAASQTVNSAVVIFGEVAAALTALAGGSPAMAALVFLAVDVAGFVTTRILVWRYCAWQKEGFGKAKLSCIKRLTAPAISFLALNFGTAFCSIQLPRLLVGQALGPEAVTIFATTATLARSIRTFGSIITFPLQPEMSRAWGARDMIQLRKLFHWSNQATILIGLIMCAGVALLGGPFLALWSHGEVPFVPLLMAGFLVEMMVGMLRQTTTILLIAINRPGQMAIVTLLAASAGALGGWLLLPFQGTPAMAAGLAAAEIVIFLFVLRQVLPILEQSLTDLFTHLFASPRPWLLKLVRR